jgi:hypothetical protein
MDKRNPSTPSHTPVAYCCPKMLAATGQNHCRERSIRFAVSGQFKVAAHTGLWSRDKRSRAEAKGDSEHVIVHWMKEAPRQGKNTKNRRTITPDSGLPRLR